MSGPRIGLALGGGGARGLAHIAMLEVFDELGLRPALIAGTSMGALVGAAYASGIAARTIRAQAEAVLGNRVELARLLFHRRHGGFFDLIDFELFGPVQVNGETLTGLVFPPGVAERVEATAIPLKIIATDFYGRSELIIDKGPMLTAVAASIAMPGLISAPLLDGRVVIDGGISNPVPFDHVRAGCDLTVAIDVTGGPVPRGSRRPANFELAFGASQILMRQINQLKREKAPPDIYIEPNVDRFRVLEWFRVHDILKAAEAAKEELRKLLEMKIAAIG